MSAEHYTYRVSWSAEDGEYVATCVEFPSLSWLAEQQEEAFACIRQLVCDTVVDMVANGEKVPEPLAEKHYSGNFQLRTTPEMHRKLAMEASESGISINRLLNYKLLAMP